LAELAIGVLTYNRVQLSRRCIISAIGNMGRGSHEFYVWDNNSKDNTAEWLSKYGRENNRITKVFFSDKNIGVHAYNNIFEYSGASYVIELDDDAIPPYGYADRMLETYKWLEKKYKIGLLGLNMNWGALTFTKRNVALEKWQRYKSPFGDFYVVYEKGKTDLVPGTCRMSSRKVWDELEGQPDRLYGTDKIMNDKSFEKGHVNIMLDGIGGKAMQHFCDESNMSFRNWKHQALRNKY